MTTDRKVMLGACIGDENTLAAAYMPFISNGGLFVQTRKEVHMGCRITLRLRLLDSSREFVIDGVVIWQTPSSMQDAARQGVGIQFGANAIALRTRIEDILAANKQSDDQTFTV